MRVLKVNPLKNWKIEINPTAEKSYRKLDKKTRVRIKEALLKLEKSDNPFLEQHVRSLTGELKGDFRLRVGDLRILLTYLLNTPWFYHGDENRLPCGQ